MQSRWTVGVALAAAALAVGLAGWLAVSLVRLEQELAATRAALAAERAEETEAALSLAQCRIESALRDALQVPGSEALVVDPTACECDPEVVCEMGSLAEEEGEPDESTPAAGRDAALRAYLEARVARAGDELDEATQREVVELLFRVRKLRQNASGTTAPDEARTQALELSVAEEEFTRLTGEGVGEFLNRVAEPVPARSRAASEETPLLDGAERKRFADEVSRMLGVTEPGAVEVLEDGDWRSE